MGEMNTNILVEDLSEVGETNLGSVDGRTSPRTEFLNSNLIVFIVVIPLYNKTKQKYLQIYSI